VAYLVSDLKTLQVGRDFIDAVASKPASHGEIEHANAGPVLDKRLKWTSTLDIASTERYLRANAEKHGARVTYFSSQAT